jgi:hypothetical protein
VPTKRVSATEGFASDKPCKQRRAQEATVFPRIKKLEEI